MKKIAATLLTFVISISAYALPIGNPWEASLMCDGVFQNGQCPDNCDPCFNWCDVWSVRVGFYGDYVFNYHMEVDRSRNHSSIHSTEIWTNAGYLALNFCDRVDLFGVFGSTQLQINTPRIAFGGAGDNDYATVETEAGFSWSFGLRGTIWECGCFAVGAETQYFHTCPNINFVKRENSAPNYRNGDHLNYQEWQIGLGAAYRINISSCATAAIPYLGIKWSRAWIDMNEITLLQDVADLTFFDLRSERGLGYAFGLTLLGCNKISVTGEARFGNEKALYINGQFRF